MNVLIIYDSYFGNTQQVAMNYHKELEKDFFVTTIKAKDVVKANIEQFDVLIFGCPTRAFNMTKSIKHILKNRLFVFENKYAFAFDTRFPVEQAKQKILIWMMKKFGYAAPKIDKLLQKRKAKIILPCKYYYVLDTEGPLETGVTDKVIADCKELKGKIKELV